MVLCFGLIRPYKGIDVLLEAFRELEGAELWIVGMPRMPLDAAASARRALPGHGPLRRRASSPTPRSRPTSAAPTWSSCPTARSSSPGVLYTALAFGKPIVASDVGGFAEVARRDRALRLVPPGDPAALRRARSPSCSASPRARGRLAAAAAARGRGPVLVGRDRRADAARLPAGVVASMIAVESRLLGSRRRCSSTPTSATRSLLAALTRGRRGPRSAPPDRAAAGSR